MRFTQKPLLLNNQKQYSQNLGRNMSTSSSTVVTTSEVSSTQSVCHRNGKRNSCRCCNHIHKQSTNIIENIQLPTPINLKHEDCSYNGFNYGLCDNSSGCFMSTSDKELVCCKDWTKNKGCND